jgi:hypothetical protein
MNHRTVRFLGVGTVVAAVLVLLATQQARSQINASPALVPIGVSASGNSSTVWFHEPSSRLAVACQTASAGGATLSAIHCVSTKLP